MVRVEECVSVVVRVRPMRAQEVESNCGRCVAVVPAERRVDIRAPGSSAVEAPKSFFFDAVYDCNASQSHIYEDAFANSVDAVLRGFNATIFAYGQTGTGKTYTMEGVAGDEQLQGVIPRAFTHVFEAIANDSTDAEYLVTASYLEIYQEEIRDLLTKDQKKRLELKERPDTGVYVKDLSSFVCKSRVEIDHVMRAGNANRSVGATNMNEHSSRSHAIFLVTIECATKATLTNDKEGMATSLQGDETRIRAGKLNLVDLAGSERQAKTGASGERLREATRINLSLSALGNVISALVDPKTNHVPYRDSKLTRLLQDSLGGNAKTVMVANIGPADYNYEESLTTLRYANRAKNIKNRPKINEDPKDALLREFQEEIAQLKAQLGQKRTKSANKRQNKKEKLSKSETSATISSSISSSVSSDSEETAEELKARLAVDRDLLQNDTTLLAEEKQRLLEQLTAKEHQLLKQREQQESIKARLKAMESKLLHGNNQDALKVDMVTKTREQQQQLELQRVQLAERRQAERDAAKRLEEKEEANLLLEKTYSSLHKEVEAKTKKLKKIFSKLQLMKREMSDIGEEFRKDREQLETNQQELIRDIKLNQLIIDNFIAPAAVKRVASNAVFNELEGSWTLNDSDLLGAKKQCSRPVSALGLRRPLSERQRRLGWVVTPNGSRYNRYRGENIMRLNLQQVESSVREYRRPETGAARIKAALTQALNNAEQDVFIDVKSVYNDGSNIKRSASRGKGSASAMNSDTFPASRGYRSGAPK